MHGIIKRLFLELDAKTLIWPGHEYTLPNLEFASILEPNNAALKVRLMNAKVSRSKEESTVPSTWKYELMTNPFLRIDSRTRDGELWVNIMKYAPSLVLESTPQSIHIGNERRKDTEEIIILDCLRSIKDSWKAK
jgi:hypothetical protein